MAGFIAPRILRGLAFFEGGHVMVSKVLDPEPLDITVVYREALIDLEKRTESLPLYSVSLSVDGKKVYFWQSTFGVLVTWEVAGQVSGIFQRAEVIPPSL